VFIEIGAEYIEWTNSLYWTKAIHSASPVWPFDYKVCPVMPISFGNRILMLYYTASIGKSQKICIGIDKFGQPHRNKSKL